MVSKIGETPEIFPRCSFVNRDGTLSRVRKKVNRLKIELVADKNVCYWKGAPIQGDLIHRISAAALALEKLSSLIGYADVLKNELI